MWEFRSCLGWFAALIVVLAFTCPLAAQPINVEVNVEVGLPDVGRHVIRPGSWTPMRVRLQSNSPTVRQVICQWVLSDIDGDRIVAQQPYTLNPAGAVAEQFRWLYAQIDVHTNPRTKWDVQVVDAETGEVLGSKPVWPAPDDIIHPSHNVIGVLGASGRDMGLDAYVDPYTQHEANRFIALGRIDQLPDRWYGLSMMQAIIWTKNGGDPENMSDSAQEALRQWVERGGHLVIVLPYVTEPWSRSRLRDMLPAYNMVQHSDQRLLDFLGRSPQMEALRIDYRELTPMTDSEAAAANLADNTDVAVLLQHKLDDGGKRTVALAHRYGFGRVTVVGIDLTDPRLRDQRMPNGPHVWRAVFGWRSPAYTGHTINMMRDAEGDARLVHWDSRSTSSLLGRDIEAAIAMRETATPGLMLAILLFILYWLAAGPLGFAYLRTRGLLRHSWMAFVAVVAIVSVIAWGGAYLMRPSRAMIRHFTVIDIDNTTNRVRAHTWNSLFVPKHGRVDVAIDPDLESANFNLLGSAGVRPAVGAADFQNAQRYVVDAGSPADASFPFRSTSKQLEIDFLGRLPADSAWVDGRWILPHATADGLEARQLTASQTVPVGSVVHELPAALGDVLLVYCPGDNAEPLVYRHSQPWEPKQILQIRADARWDPLAIDPASYRKREFHREGYLGRMLARMANLPMRLEEGELPDAQAVKVSPEEIVQQIELLTFYGSLPPPDFHNRNFSNPGRSYTRPVGRGLDMTALLATRQLIIIGHLQNAAMPIPLSVDGEVVPSEGWTVVRAICEVK